MPQRAWSRRSIWQAAQSERNKLACVEMLEEQQLGWRRIQLKKYRYWVRYDGLTSRPKLALDHDHTLYGGQNGPWQ